MSWIEACKGALAKEPEYLIKEAYSYGGVVVAASLLCAAVSGAMFAKWYALEDARRTRVWNLYGWFSALICLGSVMLVIATTAWTMFLVNFYPADANNGSLNADLSMSQALRFLIAYAISAPFSLACLVVAKLLVIHRFANFLDPRMQLTRPRFVLLGRIVVGVVVGGSFVGFICNIAAAVFVAKSSDLYTAAAYNMSTRNLAAGQLSRGSELASVFYGFEAFALLLIVVILFTIGTLGARGIAAALNSVAQGQSQNLTSRLHPAQKKNAVDAAVNKQLLHAVNVGQHLQRQILATVAVVCVSFLLRAAYSIMFAVASSFQNTGIPCEKYSGGRCSECYNSFTHMQLWMLNTPSFQLMVIFLSQPVTLLVAMWGMTSGHTLQVMRAQGRQEMMAEL